MWRVALEVAARGPVEAPADGDLVRTAHRTIDRVTDDVLRRFQFHTPIAALFELVNEIYKVKDDPERAGEVRFATETALSLVQPYAPHVAEELWERLGHGRLWETPWPVADEALVAAETVEVVVQVNARLRDRLHVPVGTPDGELVALALASERVQAHLEGEPKKTIVVADRLVNLVA
jgi:leucyl-tRNA synthetase